MTSTATNSTGGVPLVCDLLLALHEAQADAACIALYAREHPA